MTKSKLFERLNHSHLICLLTFRFHPTVQSTIENLSKSGASVELQETISQFQTELAKMDINFDKIKIPMKMPDNWDEELPETSDISVNSFILNIKSFYITLKINRLNFRYFQ